MQGNHKNKQSQSHTHKRGRGNNMEIDIRRKRVIEIVLTRKEISRLLKGKELIAEEADIDDDEMHTVIISVEDAEDDEDEE